MNDRYAVVLQHLVGNEDHADVVYDFTGIAGPDRAAVIREGVAVLEHDDFNIATVRNGLVFAFGWGLDDFGPDEDGAPWYGHDLAQIQRAYDEEVANV